MTTPRLIVARHQYLSFGLAALFTSAVLLSLGAQADGRHAGAVAHNTRGAANAANAASCAVQPGAARS